MRLKEEQCNKVCKILDDVLANRPTERNSLIAATKNAFSALSEPQWIPIKEKLPPKNGFYLITRRTCGVITTDAQYFYKYGLFWSKSNNDEILAWMPLPEPYMEVTE